MPQNKPKLTALLLSLFVLPGLGHMHLKKKKEGYIIIALVAAIIFVLSLFFVQEYKTQIHTIRSSYSFLEVMWEGIKKTWEATQTSNLLGLEAFGIIWLAAALDLLRR